MSDINATSAVSSLLTQMGNFQTPEITGDGSLTEAIAVKMMQIHDEQIQSEFGMINALLEGDVPLATDGSLGRNINLYG